MRQLLNYAVIALMLLGCKKEPEPKPQVTQEERDLVDFKVVGVPDENISATEHGFLVRLPEDYARGNKIKVTFKGWEEVLERDVAKLGGWEKNEITYMGRSIGIYLYGTDWTRVFSLYVVPFKPVEPIGTGKPHERVLDGNRQTIDVQVRNWGTMESPGYDSYPHAKYINRKNGQIRISDRFVCNQEASPDGTIFLTLGVPHDMEAGDYDIVLQHREQDFKYPDPLILTYGEPVLQEILTMPYVFDPVRSTVLYGYNLTPDHSYAMELSNDFSKTVQVPLQLVDWRRLLMKIPPQVSEGNYEMKILIDGKQVGFKNNIFRTDDLLLVQKDSIQPHIMSLSHISQRYLTEYSLDVFHPIIHFKRGQEIMALCWNPYVYRRDEFTKLNITNVETGDKYALNMNSFFNNIYLAQPYFPIPESVLPGRYEVSYQTGSDSLKIYRSVRYHKIITIE